MTRNLPEPKPEPSRPTRQDGDQRVYAAAECVLNRIHSHRVTGTNYIRIDSKEGGIMSVRISTEEVFEPRT